MASHRFDRMPRDAEAAQDRDQSTRMLEMMMTAFNVVRFRVRPGRDQDFLDAHKKVQANWPGLAHVNVLKTGDRSPIASSASGPTWMRLRRRGRR